MHANMWMWAHTFETEQLGMIPLQGVLCYSRGPHCHVPCTIGRPFVLHGTLGCGPTRSRQDTGNGISPRCSMSFQGPTSPCPVYHRLAICLTRDTGLWAQQLETKHPGMFPSQDVPCHSRGPHSHGLCTIGRPFDSHGTLGCGPTQSRQDTRNGIIPRCSVSFKGPTSLCPMYHRSAICLTRVLRAHRSTLCRLDFTTGKRVDRGDDS